MSRTTQPLMTAIGLVGGSLAAVVLSAFWFVAGMPGYSFAASQTSTLGAADLTGLWQLCYDAEHSDALEKDRGYLVLSPDGTYLRLVRDAIEGETTHLENGRYSVRDQLVRFRPTAIHTLSSEEPRSLLNLPEARAQTWELIFEAEQPVRLFDAMEQPVARDVLRWPQGIDYGYARAF